MIVQVFITQRQPVYPLCHQSRQWVFDLLRPSIIGKAGGQPLGQMQPPLHLAPPQTTRIGGHVAAIELDHYLAPIQGSKPEAGLGTLCHSRSRSLLD